MSRLFPNGCADEPPKPPRCGGRMRIVLPRDGRGDHLDTVRCWQERGHEGRHTGENRYGQILYWARGERSPGWDGRKR